MKKNLFAVAMLLTLSVGAFSACSSEDPINSEQKVIEGTSHMSLELSLPQTSTRALDDDYNKVGEWAGKDDINSIQIYVFNDADQLEVKQTFTRGQFALVQRGGVTGTNKAVIRPLEAIKVTPGAKKVYVVVNPTAETTTYVWDPTTVGSALNTFETLYKGVHEVALQNFENTPASGTPITTNAEQIAKTVDAAGTNTGNVKDQILMTGSVGTVTVVDGVTRTETLADATKNRVVVDVVRDVARVMVTSKTATFDIKGDNPMTEAIIETDYVIGTVSNLTYAVAQGERKLYFQQRADFQTPAYAFTGYVEDQANAAASEALQHYDYRGLWKNYNATGISGKEIPTTALYHTDETKITAELERELSGEFILPNVHAYGADAASTGYRKSNTAYILVRGLMTPAHVYTATGNGTPIAGADFFAGGTPKNFYLGANGRFYDSNETAHDAAKGGVPGQNTTLYKNGKVIYFAWINPDVVNDSGKGWLNSPVVRNNIYHFEISGLLRIGANWNPLVPPVPLKPGEPGYDPNTPTKPNPNQPNNPDPKPTPDENPNEPNTPPVQPEDPLTPNETWMSVETRILPWKVHTYSSPLTF